MRGVRRDGAERQPYLNAGTLQQRWGPGQPLGQLFLLSVGSDPAGKVSGQGWTSPERLVHMETPQCNGVEVCKVAAGWGSALMLGSLGRTAGGAGPVLPGGGTGWNKAAGWALPVWGPMLPSMLRGGTGQRLSQASSAAVGRYTESTFYFFFSLFPPFPATLEKSLNLSVPRSPVDELLGG